MNKAIFTLKTAYVVTGIFYWCYGLAPIADVILNALLLVSLPFGVYLILQNNVYNKSVLSACIVIGCGLITAIVSDYDRVSLIMLAYAFIEVTFLAQCPKEVSSKKLFNELVLLSQIIVIVFIIILSISILTYIFGLNANYSYSEITTTRTYVGMSDTGALTGIYGNANALSSMCVYHIGLCYFLVHNHKKIVLNSIGLLLGVICLLLTLSRGGLIAASAFAILVVMNAVKNRMGRGYNWVFIVFGAIALAVFLFITQNRGIGFGSRSVEEMGRSASARYLLWEAGLTVSTNNIETFLFGVGGVIRDAIGVVANTNIPENLYNNMHNIYMQTLVSYGFLGLLAIAGFVCCQFCYSLKRSISVHTYAIRDSLMPISYLLLSVMLLNIVESDMYMNSAAIGSLFWALLGYNYHVILSKVHNYNIVKMRLSTISVSH